MRSRLRLAPTDRHSAVYACIGSAIQPAGRDSPKETNARQAAKARPILAANPGSKSNFDNQLPRWLRTLRFVALPTYRLFHAGGRSSHALSQTVTPSHATRSIGQ